MSKNLNPSVAVLLPCYNEEVTIGKVVRDFKAALPHADIYVYDNNSTDRTAEIAMAEGAIVRKEPRQGKGNVIRAMFEDIDADVYVMADGEELACIGWVAARFGSLSTFASSVVESTVTRIVLTIITMETGSARAASSSTNGLPMSTDRAKLLNK